METKFVNILGLSINTRLIYTAILKAATSLFIVQLLACTQPDPILTVKNSILDTDKTVTIGQAFDTFQFFIEKKWETFIDDKKRTVVRFSGTLNTNFDMHIMSAIYAAKNFNGVQHAFESTDILWEYQNGYEICSERWDKNKSESARILRVADSMKDYKANITIDFAKNIQSNDISIINKEIEFFKSENGQISAAKSTCNTDIVFDIFLQNIYKNTPPFDTLKECLFSYDIQQCKLAKKKYYYGSPHNSDQISAPILFRPRMEFDRSRDDVGTLTYDSGKIVSCPLPHQLVLPLDDLQSSCRPQLLHRPRPRPWRNVELHLE